MRRLFVRSLAIAFVVFAFVFGAEFFLEWRRAGYPAWGAQSWAGIKNEKLIDVLSPMARAYNNVLAMLIAFIGFAIPLTASMHTPKLIEIFLRDRLNRWVLAFMAFGAAHVLWVDYLVGPEFAPTWAITLAVVFALVGWAILVPYFFYVVRFIDPSRLLVRLREESMAIVRKVAERKLDPSDAQLQLSRRVSQVGTLILKSLDRNDRDVAAEGAWAIKLLIDHYASYKARMPKEWFVVDRGDFVGLSDEALEMLTEDRTWFEMKCLHQIERGFLHAVPKVNDVVSVFSDVLRVIATRADGYRDTAVLRLCIRFFNNFLREAIRARNLRSIYDVFQQYRRLGRELLERPELLRELGKHFSYYAEMARRQGLLFAPQLVVFDLGFVARRAYEGASTAAADLLAEVLTLPHRTQDDLHSMAVKAKLILGGFFVENNLAAEAELVRRNLADVPSIEIERAEGELLAAERSFFEVSDRQLNLEYVPPERREPLRAFCASLVAKADR